MCSGQIRALPAGITNRAGRLPLRDGLAAPTAILIGTGRGAQLGILIKGPQVLESTRTIDTIVLDKTGTVTTGQMALAEMVPSPGEDPDEVLRLAGAAEDPSGHPIGAAIADGARGRLGAELPDAEEFTSYHGLGVTAVTGAGPSPTMARRSRWPRWGSCPR